MLSRLQWTKVISSAKNMQQSILVFYKGTFFIIKSTDYLCIWLERMFVGKTNWIFHFENAPKWNIDPVYRKLLNKIELKMVLMRFIWRPIWYTFTWNQHWIFQFPRGLSFGLSNSARVLNLVELQAKTVTVWNLSGKWW